MQMELAVVGAGVGRTGTHSLKLALEQLLGAPCHHMLEILGDPSQIPAWIDAIDGRPVDWSSMLERYRAIVDWPGGSFWPELSSANPNALVLLSVRDPESWYRSASNTIFLTFDKMPPEIAPWMDAVRRMLHDRFSDRFDDPMAMMDAYERHNDAVRTGVPASRLLEWTPSEGWDPICERLGVAVPREPFPVTNSTNEFREMIGMPALE
jgi:Sulfotransferase domain